jgi:hypothetical protein
MFDTVTMWLETRDALSNVKLGSLFVPLMIDTVTLWFETRDALSNVKLVSLFVPYD